MNVLSAAARRFTRHPLLLLLPVQAAVLFWRLDRLPVWGDEEMTRAVATAPWPEAVRLLGSDIHPPLYFAIAHAWLQLPWAAEPVVALRALSALFALLSGLIVYAGWIAYRAPATRWWFAALWVTSPFLLLYGRMARSYSLQMLFGVLAIAAAERLLRQWARAAVRGDSVAPHVVSAGAARNRSPSGAWSLIAYIAAATLLFYTHYLPGTAVIAAVSLVLLWRLGRRRDPALLVPLFAPPLAVALAGAPWLSHFALLGERVAYAAPYPLTANPLLDHIVQLAYVVVSFTVGEAMVSWAIPLAALTLPLVVWLAIVGAAPRPLWLAVVGLAAAIAFVAAARWVSYAFIAARLSFVFPFWLLLLVSGIARRPSFGRVAGTAMVVAAVAGMASYVRLEGFLNKAYVLPVDAIAARIATHASAADTVVLLDPHGANLNDGLRRRLPAEVPVIELWDRSADEARRRALDANVATVWIVRSTIDRSPDHWVAKLEAELAAQAERRDHAFTPYSALDRFAMRLAGWSEQPTHVVDVVELRRK